VAEWISQQTSLPNNLQMPCRLPLPIPAFNVENSLKIHPDTGLYHQPSNNNIYYIIKERYKSTWRVFLSNLVLLFGLTAREIKESGICRL